MVGDYRLTGADAGKQAAVFRCRTWRKVRRGEVHRLTLKLHPTKGVSVAE
jgi:hypothetical protein